MRIDELLNRALPWEWVTDSKAIFDSPNGTPYHTYCQRFSGNSYLFGFDTMDSFDGAFTHEGQAFAILSTAIEILQDFVANHPNVKSIIFAAKSNEPSRVAVYRRLVQRFSYRLGFAYTEEEKEMVGYDVVLFTINLDA